MSNILTYEPITATKNDKETSESEILVFIPKKVLNKKTIPTLFITDLPFTADKLINADAPIIGYKGITNQHSDNLRVLAPELIDIIGRKKVKNIVLLYNSNCMDPEFKPGSDADLSLHMFNIYYAVKNFRDLLSDYDNEMVLWFAHTKHRFFSEKIITLNDLADDQKPKTVAEQLKKFKNKTNPFFEKINISEYSLNRLYTHLKLKDVTSFYSYHSALLSYSEFIFKHVRYYHDGDKLEKIQHTDSKLYLRAGGRYYKRLMIPNSHGEYEEQLKPWIIGEITRDYGNNFFDQISKYDSFVNKPCNTGEYQRVITTNHNGLSSDLYNIYNPVDWDPKEGEWSNIKSFLEHIFESCNLDGEVLYEFGLDWIQHCYISPIQRLPALCLVSKEKNTGKSTFLDFLKMIFQSNMTILDNERFRSQFTSHYAGKLIIGLDEGYIPVHDKLMKERIKNMIIGKVQWLEGKGTNAESVDNFAKMIMCSNDENNFMQIDKDENRFAVLKIRTFKECGIKDDPDLMDKMRKEIPAFLNFLLNRKLHYHEKISRFWFSEHIYTTPALKVVIDKTKSRLSMELEEFLQDQFLSFEQDILQFQLKDIIEVINKDRYKVFDKSDLKDYLQEERKIFSANKVTHYKIYSFNENSNNDISIIQKKGRVYTFHSKDWLTKEQIKNFKPIVTL